MGPLSLLLAILLFLTPDAQTRCIFDEQTESYNNGGCNGSEDAYSYKNE